jgi:antitoxin Phd
MPRQYSVTEARHHFTALVEEVEQGAILELTRRGKPVAVLLSFQEYKRLAPISGKPISPLEIK